MVEAKGNRDAGRKGDAIPLRIQKSDVMIVRTLDLVISGATGGVMTDVSGRSRAAVAAKSGFMVDSEHTCRHPEHEHEQGEETGETTGQGT